MPQSGDYELLPVYATSPPPRLRASRNTLLTNIPSLNPLHRSQSDSHQRPLTAPRRQRTCGLFTITLPALRLTRFTALLAFAFKYLLPLAVIILLYLLYLYEPHIELSFYSRPWIRQEIHKLEPLGGCFDPQRVSSKYNVSQYVYGPKRMEVQAGLPLRFGMDCYDFAGTIQSSKLVQDQSGSTVGARDRTMFHTYWRVDLASFGHRQEWMIKSYFATQDLESTRLVLWSNGDLGGNEILRGYLRKYPEAFALRVVDIKSLARGTPLEGSGLLDMKDRKAWLDGDLVRLLLLWNFGGVWVDMDSLLTRDLEPLLEHEFVTQWDCYGASIVLFSCVFYRHTLCIDKLYSPFNGALLRFHQHSPYLCEAFHIMATSTPPRPGSTDWGSLLYLKLWRRLVANNIPPFKVLPFCFNDGRSCRLDNRLPDPFKPDRKDGIWTEGLGVEEGGGLDKVLQKVFAVHLHNQWDKEFPTGGWVDRLLLKRYDMILRGGVA